MDATFRTEVSESPTRVRLIGELDLACALQATEEILASGCHVVDCADLTFIDSSGLVALTNAHLKVQANGQHLVFTGFAGAPLHVLKVTGLNEVLHLA